MSRRCVIYKTIFPPLTFPSCGPPLWLAPPLPKHILFNSISMSIGIFPVTFFVVLPAWAAPNTTYLPGSKQSTRKQPTWPSPGIGSSKPPMAVPLLTARWHSPPIAPMILSTTRSAPIPSSLGHATWARTTMCSSSMPGTMSRLTMHTSNIPSSNTQCSEERQSRTLIGVGLLVDLLLSTVHVSHDDTQVHSSSDEAWWQPYCPFSLSLPSDSETISLCRFHFIHLSTVISLPF